MTLRVSLLHNWSLFVGRSCLFDLADVLNERYLLGNRGSREFPCIIWCGGSLRAVSSLLSEHSIVPQPTACILPAQRTKSPPETWKHSHVKKRKKKKFGQQLWVGPRRHRWCGDKGDASSRGLAPIRSKPEDKTILSTLSLYPPTTHLPELSCHRGRNKSSPRFAFVPVTGVKQNTRGESGRNKASLSATPLTDHRVWSTIVPCQFCGSVFWDARRKNFSNFCISCTPCLQIV